MSEVAEIWRPVVGYPGQEVSSLGRVRSSIRSNKQEAGPWIRKPTPNDGYLYLWMGSRPRRKTVSVHSMVLEAFVGPRSEGAHACHWNGDKADNRLENLRWASPAENSHDKFRHGAIRYGERHPSARFTDTCVERMRDMRRCGVSLNAIGSWFDIQSGHVSRIVQGQRWRRANGSPV